MTSFRRFAGLLRAACVLGACVLTAPVRLQAQASVVQAATAEGRFNDAVRALDAAADASGRPPASALQSVATAILEKAAAGDDPIVAADACSTLRRHGNPRCEERMRQLESTQTTPALVRLRILADDLAAGRPGSRQRVEALTASFQAREWQALVQSASAFPPAVRVPLMQQALTHGGPDVKYMALDQLASTDTPEAVAALRPYARTSTPGHLLALAGLAKAGDREALDTLRSLLPDLVGGDLLAAGEALARQKDPQGLSTVRQVLNEPDDLLRLKTSAVLASLGQPDGVQWLDQELTNPNPWMRLRSLEYLEGLLTEPTPRVWRLMADDMAWIQVRAAQVTLSALAATPSGPSRQ